MAIGNTGYGYRDHEFRNCLLLGGALQTSIFDPRFNGLLSNIAHKDAPLIVLNVPIYGRASAGLDGVVEQLPVVRMINF